MKNNTYNTANALGINALVTNTMPVNGIRYMAVPLDYLEIQPTIQRPLKNHYKKIATEWDAAKCGCILVSYRSNHLYIIDGQHRYMAAKMLGLPNIACAVREGLTEQQEALLFGRQDENKVRLVPHEKVKALIVGHDDIALKLKKVCDDYGVSLEPSSRPYLKCMTDALNAIKCHGDVSLRWAFEVIDKARWSQEPKAYSKSVLGSLLSIYKKYGNSYTVGTVLINEMKSVGYEELVYSARLLAGASRSSQHVITAYFEELIAKKGVRDNFISLVS